MCIETYMAGLHPPAGHQWSEYAKSLFEISATEPDDNGKSDHCLDDKRSGKVKAIWFDQVMSHWTNLENKRKNNLPVTCRIDAYYVSDTGRYLIEFKKDGVLSRHKDKLWLKFHDSLTQLIDHGWVTLAQACDSLIYIVVRTGVARYDKSSFTEQNFKKLPEAIKLAIINGYTYGMQDLMQRPWKFPVSAECGLGCFEGVSCNRVLTLTVTQFDRYCQDNHWI